jgi:hypothetical protein
MTPKVQLYVNANILLGYAIVASCALFYWHCADALYFASYLVLTVLAAMFKVRLPGMRGTMSLSFLFILIGVADFSLSETVAMACAGALVQCLWRSRTRPKLTQVFFSVAVLATSSAFAYQVSHLALAGVQSRCLALLLPLAAILYFAANTLLVSGVLSLVERKPLRQAWQNCYVWTFPYYIAGALLAGLISFAGHSYGWWVPLRLVPAIYLIHVFYRLSVERLAPALTALVPNSEPAQ